MESNIDDNLPEFFKVYTSTHSSHKMSIPDEFVNYMGVKKSGAAELGGPNGRTWRVELVKDGNDMYFSNGWQAFISDNMIRDGFFLFFKFHGNLKFSVVIYDENMCEKEAGQKHDEVVETADGIPISVSPSSEKIISVSGSCLKWGCYLTFHEESLSYERNEIMVLQTGRNPTREVSIINSCGSIILRKGWSIFDRENNIGVGDLCTFKLLDRLKLLLHVVHRREGISRKRVNVAAKKRTLKKVAGVSPSRLKCTRPAVMEEEQKAAAMTRPYTAYPVFVTHEKYNVERKYVVNIPTWFLRKNSLNYQGKEEIVLRTKTDAFWLVNMIQNNQNHFLCGGWAAFVRDNNIKEGDTCKFELLSRLEMKVYVTYKSKES